MTRSLKVLGLCLVAAFALSALASSAAQAEVSSAAKFTAAVGVGETAKIDGEQVGTNTSIINGLKLTCTTVKLNGRGLGVGGSATEVTLEPTFEGCDVEIVAGSGIKKLVTITVNGCAFRLTATTTETKGGVKEFTTDKTIECPKVKEGEKEVQKKIEIHLYNSETSEAETLCTWDVGPQGPLKEIKLTNEAGTPDDILAHFNISNIALERTVGSATACGQINNTAQTQGTQILRATNANSTFVNATVSE